MAGRVWPARPFRERDPLSAVVYGSRTWRAVARDMLLGPPHYTGAAAASGTGTATVADDITFYSEGWDGTPSTSLTSGSGSWSAMFGAGTATYSADGTYAQISATASTKSFSFYYPATPSLVAVFYLRLTSLPSATTVLAQWLSPTVQVGDLRVLTSGALHLRDATTARITTPALTVGAWYRIVVISVPGSSAGHRLRVSGPGVNVDQSATATLAGQTDLTRFAIGVVSTATASVDVDSLSMRSQVETPPASSDFTGAASASGAGTATATGAPSFPVTATTSGTGTVSGTGTPAITGSAAASGTGTATASSSGYTGTATGSGTGTATAAGTPAIPAAVTSSGTGTVAGSGTPHLTVAVPATGTGTATASGTPKIVAVAGTTGVGSTTTTGTLSSSGDAVATGDGTATADGTPAVTCTATAAGDGTSIAVGVASFVVYPRRRTLTDTTTRARTVHDRTLDRALTGTGVGRRLDHD